MRLQFPQNSRVRSIRQRVMYKKKAAKSASWAIDATAMLLVARNPALLSIAQGVNIGLERVLHSLVS